MNKKTIRVDDKDFGAILNCAVRYACGRQTYMPSLVVGFITPLIPSLDDQTLYAFDQDLTNAKYYGGYGDEYIDKPLWEKFHKAVQKEEMNRGKKIYVDWRE